MVKYETLYIINAELEEEAIKAAVVKFNDLITSNGGILEKADEWGKRRLAYPIEDMNDGYYVLLSYSAAPEFPKELERNMKISEQVLRYMTTRQGE
ncbi:MAG: 30S ribosomal protein S6 [Christensenellales bacterium]|jgi:small subunit ribosomal protein S6